MNWTFTAHRRMLLGLCLVGMGVLLLIGQLFNAAGAYLWPFFIIVPGTVLVALSLVARNSLRGLAIPGMVIAGIGLILFFQNLFDHYQSWAYVWALIPFFVGAGMMLAAEEQAGEAGTEAAQNLMTWSLTAFVLFAAVFELLIFGGGIFVARIVVPLALIVAGAAFLMGWMGDGKPDHGQ